ncbi:MAG: TatD family deoxyribonuclease [Bacteroidetes bacterium]|nr:MAG: TatD family deoxyribonuclease [Bacteroidota bacterium]REK00809.1 MAG: TatD family deoxyribonuclease [Bacteroidota bacterium]REK35049.1 MAG: TatD family deoxyribonuclease [Bacteroidota bacterium]REK48372.1 MAG: TatD family deoxyribonuclease [Bacteroidota bacterium]
MTDTHIHLYDESFDADRSELIIAASRAGISRFFLPNIDSSSIDRMLQLESKYPGICFPMMGLHPCSVKQNYREELQTIEDWFNKRSFCAVGEIGIDLYWDKTFIDEQKEAFRIQVKIANEHKIPVVIHSRDSFEEIYTLLKETEKQEPFGIFHCFTGNEDQAQRAIEMGFYLGIGGVLTFKNSGLDRTIKNIPIEHLVLETDGPYLAPAPHRGKRNIPLYIQLVLKKLAELKNMNEQAIAEITTSNADRIFRIR